MATNNAVSVKELKEILAETQAPRKLVDPVTELPLWDEDLMRKVRTAKSMDEVREVDAKLRECMEPQMDEVFPGLFIGNFKGAKTIPMLAQNGITHVLNVAEGPGLASCGVFDPKPYNEAKIVYNGFVIRDNVDAKDDGQQEALFRKAADLIEEALKEDGNKVLVFCFAGLSRSASSVLSYLTMKKGLDLRDALRQIKGKRDVLPSAQNLAHLAKMFNKERNLGNPDENPEDYEIAKYRQLSR